MPRKVGYIWSEELGQRKAGSLCPERSERNSALSPDTILPAVPGLHYIPLSRRAPEILELAHDPAHIEFVRTAHKNGIRALDRGDTRVTPDVFDQALLAASAGCEAVDRILKQEVDRVFCAVRPPGHHANRTRSMGFCVFNNVAIAVRYALSISGIRRILILDWDVHPGNGTQEIFWEDPDVFTLSIHQDDLFPDAGKEVFPNTTTPPVANRNIPLPPRCAPADWISKFSVSIDEIVESFRPQILFISAGFDAHQRDPVGQMNLRSKTFGEMTQIVIEKTKPYTRGLTVSLLEGGYNPSALRDCVIEHLRAMKSTS